MSQIKQHSANGRNYLIVQVPKDAGNFRISSINNLHYHHSYEGGTLNMHQFEIVKLPPGKYTLLFIAEEATEEQAASVVEVARQNSEMPYPYYENGTVLKGYYCELATYCLHSLIRSLFPKWAECKHVILERHDTE